MPSKVFNALHRLGCILPLAVNQQLCSDNIKLLHQAILYSFIKTGDVLQRDKMCSIVDDVDSALLFLKQKNLVVFDEHLQIVGAYPFTTEDREHKLKVNGFSLNAMCALDAISVSSMFQVKTVVSSFCRVTQSKIHIELDKGKLTNQQQAKDIHIAINWSAASGEACCADSLCLEMLFLIDFDTAQHWLTLNPNDSQVFTLDESLELAGLLFNPLV